MRLKRYVRPWLLTPIAVAAAAVILVACGGTASGSTGSPTSAATAGAVSTDRVTIANSAFVPHVISVASGTTVTWTNEDPILHDVTSSNGPGTGATTTSLFASPQLQKGQTFSYTFTKPGTYYYECTIHAGLPAMHAVVVVK